MSKSQFKQREQFDRALAERNLMGHWEVMNSDDPLSDVQPHVWKWGDVQWALETAQDVVSLEDDPRGTRRSIGLRNPGIDRDRNWTSRTLSAGVQLVNPGELEDAHRHNVEAFRFIIDGQEGAYTTVEGEQFPMRDGDLIITPAGTWHDHTNLDDDPVVWLDGLDAPLWKGIKTAKFEEYPGDEGRQDADKPRGYHARTYGSFRSGGGDAPDPKGGAPPYRFPWEEAHEALRAAADTDDAHSPYDGTVVEYVNPATNEPPVMPAQSLRLQLLEVDEETEAHEHVSTEIYHVVRGAGETTVGDRTLQWAENDTFVVPSNAPHAHACGGDEAILFAMSDRPLFEAFSVYSESPASL